MAERFFPLERRVIEPSGDASTSYQVKFDLVRTGERWDISRLSFRDNTSSPTRISVYKEGRGANQYVGEKQPAVAGYIYTLDRPFRVHEGQRLVVDFVAGGSSDEMEAWLEGDYVVQEAE